MSRPSSARPSNGIRGAIVRDVLYAAYYQPSNRALCRAAPATFSSRAKARSLSDRADYPARVARGEYGVRDISRDDTAGADHGSRSDADAGENDRSATDPHVRPDLDGLPELFTAATLGVEWMQRCVDLHGRSEQREVADPDRTYIQNNAVEIEEDPLSEFDVRAVVTVEGRLHPHRVAPLGE